MKADLDALKIKPNNLHDALVAEVALEYGYGLVTADKNLQIVAEQHGIKVYYVDQIVPS